MVAARLRIALLLLSVCLCSAWARTRLEPTIRLPSELAAAAAGDETDDAVGTRWAVLVAGSSGYYNYRHQVHIRASFRSSSLLPVNRNRPSHRTCCIIGLAAYSIPSRSRTLISFVM